MGKNYPSGNTAKKIGKLYEAQKLNHGGDRNSSANFLHLKTAEEIAQKYGVNESRKRQGARTDLTSGQNVQKLDTAFYSYLRIHFKLL